MRRTLLALALALPPAAAAAQAEAVREVEVDLELVLAVDISRSMDEEELRLQRDGYVAALRDPKLIEVIRAGQLGRIAVLYMEWAGPSTIKVLTDWRLIDGPESAAAMAEELLWPPLSTGMGTSISGALEFASRSFEGNGFEGLRRVIDISGDGPNNTGAPVTEARDAVLAQGIVINGLPVMLREGGPPFGVPDLDIYYEDCVIGGPNAFVLPVLEREKFAETIRRKILLEVASVPMPGAVVPAQFGLGAPKAEPRIDCMIGERLRRRWLENRWGP